MIKRLIKWTLIIIAGSCTLIFALALVVPSENEASPTLPPETQTSDAILEVTKIAQAVATNDAQATLDVYATATATLWTPTPTLTPSNTPTNTPTPSITNTPTITNTPRPSNTPRPTNTPRPSNTPRPTRANNTTTYYVTGSTVNLRAEPNTNSSIRDVASRGDTIQVIETVTGSRVVSNDEWYRATYQGQEVYIHSSLASRNEPAPLDPPVVNPQSVAPQNNQPEQSNQPPAPAYSCNCSRTCSAMSCEEAYFQLNQCGCSRRDGDSDGVPCESVCPGG